MSRSKICDYLNKIIDVRESIEKDNKKINNNELLFAYRGEPKDYGKTKLMPSIFRENGNVEKEMYLFELISDYNVVDNNKSRNIEKAIESQHYVAMSRMLDITFNSLSALYFACISHVKEDGVFYVFGFPDHYSPHSNYIEDIYDHILKNDNNLYDKNFRVITHGNYNERIRAQSGGFIFFPGDKFCPLSNAYYKEISIEASDKKQLLEDLSLYFDIYEEKIYPSKENNASLVKKKFENKKAYRSLDKISTGNELNIFFERLDYEMEMMKLRGKTDNKDLLRLIRKEKDDILAFLKHLSDGKDYTSVVEKQFEILRRSKL